MGSWSLDFSMDEKHRIVRRKADSLGISDSEAYRLCVIEYETGIIQNQTTIQTKNAYNQYKLEAPRPNSFEDAQLKIKIKNQLLLNEADARRNQRRLEKAAKGTVKDRIDAKHGVGSYDRATRPMEERGWFSWLKIPSLSMPSMPSMPSIGLAGKGVIGLIVAIVLVLLFLVAIGYSGLGSAVGSRMEK